MDQANANSADRGQAPGAPEWQPYPVDAEGGDVAVIPTGRLNPDVLDDQYGVGVNTRPAYWDITFFERPMDWFPGNDGSHGLVPIPDLGTGLEGGQNGWENWNPRTFRQAPTTAWDAGTELA